MGKVRILYCIDTLEVEAGTERQLAEIIQHIDKERFETHLCCFEDGPRMRGLAGDCMSLVLPIVRAYTPNGLRRIWRLRRYIAEHRIDIVHTFMIKANIVGILAAWKLKHVLVVSSRRNLGYLLRPFDVRVLRFLDRRANRLLANSEGAKKFTVETEGVAPDKVDVLYNGVDMIAYAAGCADASAASSLGIPDGAKIVGIVANLRPVKDHSLFLRAAKLVSQQVPDAAFLLVGKGPLRGELARLAAELGIAERVFFTDGSVVVPDYLGRMAVGCLSSKSEGFSNAILEYMAAGLPVVATDVGGNAEAVEHGVTGYIVPHGDPAALAEPIIQLLTDERRRAEMGRRSLQRCREKFEIAAVVRRYEDYYQALVLGTKQ